MSVVHPNSRSSVLHSARYLPLVLALLSTAACGGSAKAITTPKAPVEKAETPEDGAADLDPNLGKDKETPVLRCGPLDSYQFVSKHICADGSRPLGGDPALGRKARVGNVGANGTGHIIDHYVVPCPEGEVSIYVDMYGCDAYEERVDRSLREPNPFGTPGEPRSRDELLAIAKVFGKMNANPFTSPTPELMVHAFQWIRQSPDLRIAPCPWFLDFVDGPGREHRSPVSYLLTSHLLLALARYDIEHPAVDPVAAQLAALEVVLDVYREHLKNGEPPAPSVDKLVKLDDEGKLRDWFVKNTGCAGPP